MQLAYSSINLQGKGVGKGSIGTDQTVNTAREIFVAGATRTLANVYTGSAAIEDTRIMSFKAEPVYNQDEIYSQYLDFANDPTRFCISETEPCGCVYLKRKHDQKWYWIPPEAGPAFQSLVLHTAIMREVVAPKPLSAAYPVRITKVALECPDAKKKLSNGVITLDTLVPDGDGNIVIDMKDGRRERFQVYTFGNPPHGERVLTYQIRVQWPAEYPAADFINQPARVYSFDFPPLEPGR